MHFVMGKFHWLSCFTLPIWYKKVPDPGAEHHLHRLGYPVLHYLLGTSKYKILELNIISTTKDNISKEKPHDHLDS